MNPMNTQSKEPIHRAALRGGGIFGLRLASLRRLRRLGREDGASLVEAAFTLPILFALIFGATELGYLFYTYQDVCDAARKATRWAAVHGSSAGTACSSDTITTYNCTAGTTDIQNFVQGLGYPGVSGSAMTVNPTFWCVENGGNSATWVQATGANCPSGTDDSGLPANTPGNEVQVQVSYQFPLTIAYWKATTVTLSSTGSMVIQY